ncbi:hypothetical protein OROMI_018562 [Orobanche minor]
MDFYKDHFNKKYSVYLRYSKCESKTNHKHQHKHKLLLGFMNLNSANLSNKKLRNNTFRAKLDMSGNISRKLQLIDLDNDISSVTVGSKYKSTLVDREPHVHGQIQQSTKPHSTSLEPNLHLRATNVLTPTKGLSISEHPSSEICRTQAYSTLSK